MKKFIVYVINDDYAEEAIHSDESYELTGMDYETEFFDSVNDAEYFIQGLFFGCDERAPTGKAVLRSWEAQDSPFIEALLMY